MKMLILGIILGIIGIEVWLLGDFSTFRKDASVIQLAQKVYDICSIKMYPPSCYDEEIPKLMGGVSRLTLAQAFEVTRLIQKKDNRYLYCHVLGHKLSSVETRKNPANWKDVLTRCPTTICNNGCLHGALMERFKSENLTPVQIEQLKPDLKDVCEPRGTWNPVEVERSMCYHALGHLHMYITKADMGKSVELCKEIGVKKDGRNYVQTCTEGVFMQIYQPLEPEDFALVKNITPKKENVVSFCSKYSGEAWEACRREAWPLFRQDILDSPQGFISFCSYSQDPEAQRKCYGASMNWITLEYFTDRYEPTRFKEYCMGLPGVTKAQCFANAATRLIQIDPTYTDRALELCVLAKKEGLEAMCYRDLAYFGRETYHPETAQFSAYCKNLPSPWNGKCLRQEYTLIQ